MVETLLLIGGTWLLGLTPLADALASTIPGTSVALWPSVGLAGSLLLGGGIWLWVHRQDSAAAMPVLPPPKPTGPPARSRSPTTPPPRTIDRPAAPDPRPTARRAANPSARPRADRIPLPSSGGSSDPRSVARPPVNARVPAVPAGSGGMLADIDRLQVELARMDRKKGPPPPPP